MTGNNPQKWVKKPVEIEAMLFDGDTSDVMAVYHWVEANTLGSYDTNADDKVVPESGVSIDAATGQMVIATLEGEMRVNVGDYVIKGVMGEFYPCKPGIFHATYTEALILEKLDNEKDRNARAYGFEIGRGHPLYMTLEVISDDNPFLKSDWKDNIIQPDEAQQQLELGDGN